MICDTVPMEDEMGGLRFRYWLHRDLASDGREGLVFVMLNPSTADAMHDDPTVRRCMAFGRRWGYRELTVVNLFALRATKPEVAPLIMPISIGTGHNKLVGTSRCFSDCAGDAVDGCSERTPASKCCALNNCSTQGIRKI